MNIQEHLWDFPCHHDLKVMGLAHFPLADVVTEVVRRHAPDFDPASIRAKHSRTGKYISITATVYFTSKAQAEAIFLELHQREEVSQTL